MKNTNRIGIGFIGGGFITRFHIKSLIGVRDCDVIGVMSKTRSSAAVSYTHLTLPTTLSV